MDRTIPVLYDEASFPAWHKYSYEYSDGPHGPPRAHPAWLGPPAGPAAVAANPWPGGSLWVRVQ